MGSNLKAYTYLSFPEYTPRAFKDNQNIVPMQGLNHLHKLHNQHLSDLSVLHDFNVLRAHVLLNETFELFGMLELNQGEFEYFLHWDSI